MALDQNREEEMFILVRQGAFRYLFDRTELKQYLDQNQIEELLKLGVRHLEDESVIVCIFRKKN